MNIYKYVLRGETPAKKNNRITLKNGKTIPSQKYREWHENALIQLLTQTKPQEPIQCPVKISFNFTHGDKRRRDSDNGTSSILDLLQDVQILHDDNWEIVREIEIKNGYCKNAPSVEVTIQKIAV